MVHHTQTADRVDARGPDTIAAISTPAGVGGIGVVRLSGTQCRPIASALAGAVPRPRKAQYQTFKDADGRPIDQGIALYFPAPRSYTGEDVLELQCHGGPVVLNMLLGRVLELGARTAQPGEFTERAFLNDKLDLAQAEAVADLIMSSTEAAARSAMRSLLGDFSARVHEIRQSILELRMYVEAAIDFPEEEIDFLDDQSIVQQLDQIRDELTDFLASAARGRVFREGLDVAIAGLPNAGKSSLLNCLAGMERSIVTPQAGTTRDTVDLMIDLNGLAVRLTDTAGLRASTDPVEREGVDRAWLAVREASLVLYLVDMGQGLTDADLENLSHLENCNVLLVWNKIDLAQDSFAPPALPKGVNEQLSISAKYTLGIDLIGSYIQQFAGFTVSEESLFLARHRHLEAMQNALEFINQAYTALYEQRLGDLGAEDLRDAMNELGKLVGEISPDDLLGEIFANFCIGK